MIKPEFRGQVANVDSTSDDMKRNYNGIDINFNARMPRGVRAFGGFNLERSHQQHLRRGRRAIRTSRSTAISAESGIPWQKQFKGTVVYPLPWYGISVSAAYPEPQRLPDRQRRRRPTAASPPAPASTVRTARPPSGRSRSTTRYAANCTGPCTPNGLVLPALAASGVANIQVPLVAPETEYTPRINQVDFSVSKRFEFGDVPRARRRWTCSTRSTRMTTRRWRRRSSAPPTYQQPSVILQGRIIRIGADVSW